MFGRVTRRKTLSALATATVGIAASWQRPRDPGTKPLGLTGNIVPLEAFGAKNWSQALMDACSYLKAKGGGTITVGTGDKAFEKTCKLNFCNDIKITGYGARFVRDWAHSNGNGDMLSVSMSENFVLEGITIFGDSEAYGVNGSYGAHNLNISGCRNIVLRQIKSTHAVTDGVRINRVAAGILDGVSVADTDSNGAFYDCIVECGGRQGLSVIACSSLLVSGGRIVDTGKSSAGFIAPGASVDLERNVPAYPPRNVRLVGVEFGGGKSGVIVNVDSVDTVIENCTIKNAASYGIINTGSNTRVINTRVVDCGRPKRPSIVNGNARSGSVPSSLTLDGVEIVGAIHGGINVEDRTITYIRNTVVRDGANYGLRWATTAGADLGEEGLLDIDGLRVERLHASEPIKNVAYLFGARINLPAILRRIVLDPKSAKGTSIGCGARLDTLLNVREMSDWHILSTFPSFAVSGMENVSIAQRNTEFSGTSSSVNHPKFQLIEEDSSISLSVRRNAPQIMHSGMLTADRSVSLSKKRASVGDKFRITRTGGGTFKLNVGDGPLKSLATDAWCEVIYDGSVWRLMASGVLYD
ncbi:right-handed parallel beta-helix repeat-containing protein [Mesorhizobium sp. ES1-1]|uniref:right-handed parallel beta-helix repeat-containing protein n=1 Tax=Mesorhizobium sp. ES1-1 TaxID=2876629 RepID=UPI001CCF7DA9|nr:right-handed parallel beta-helix repeat-containing protein [Mesorhizobium sp. ES1-1]MBZ9674716.1 right-handed parallel beta-helix repeat-containing protein [Mesorhizobium sp. ES1-1]